MKWKNRVADYFVFTRKERIGLLFFICLIILVFLLPDMVRNHTAGQVTQADTAWIAAVKKLEIKDQPGDNNYAHEYDRTINHSPSRDALFYFDPNTISRGQWKKLGLRDKTIHTIENYLSKGGRFKRPEDLQRVYGLFPNEYARIAPYIKIEAAGETNNDQEYAAKSPAKKESPKTYTSRFSTIEINLADTTAFISLPGIGGKLAVRIVNFRDKLGGFYAINQIGEIYGLADSTFQKIKPYLKLDNTTVKKININTATVDELKTHPYIKYTIANPLIAYRNEHGSFSKIEDLKKVMAVTDAIYDKLVPYLTLQ